MRTRRSNLRHHVEKLARMTPEEASQRLSLIPPAGCRNSFSSCNDGKATSDDLHRKDWDGSSPQAGPGGSSPTFLPSRRGAFLDVDRGIDVGCRSTGSTQHSIQIVYGQSASSEKVMASNGGRETGASPAKVANNTHLPSFNSKTSSVFASGSTNQRWRTPSRA